MARSSLAAGKSVTFSFSSINPFSCASSVFVKKPPVGVYSSLENFPHPDFGEFSSTPSEFSSSGISSKLVSFPSEFHP